MKNKTKYAICALICAVLVSASAVLMLPIRHGATFEGSAPDMETLYKFIYDMKAGNADGAETAALKLPLGGASLKVLHKIISHMRKNKLTEEEKKFILTIADDKNINNTIAEIEKYAQNEMKTIAENNEKEENEAKKALNRILDNGIKLKTLQETPSENIICIGGENMYVEMDRWENFILHLSYTCSPGPRRLSPDECREKAKRFFLRNMPRRYSAKRPVFLYVGESFGCDCFTVDLASERLWIKVRCDTGALTLFCGYGMELSIYNN